MIKGFTLVEVMVVIVIMGIASGISLSTIRYMNNYNDSKEDIQVIRQYQKAIDNFRIEDYSNIIIYKNNGLSSSNGKIENGAIIYADIAGLSDNEIKELSTSGRGIYPNNRDAVLGSIKVYGVDIVSPAQKKYSFYFNTANKKVELKDKGYSASGYILIG